MRAYGIIQLLMILPLVGCRSVDVLPRHIAAKKPVHRSTAELARLETASTGDESARSESFTSSRTRFALASYQSEGTQKPQQIDAEVAQIDEVQELDLESVGQEDTESVPESVVPAPITESTVATSANLPVVTTPLMDVAAAIHNTFPLLQAAYRENQIAAGNQISAWGSFDTKLKGASESGPLGFYETYRNSFGFQQPIYHGGEVFGGYRVGRGDFQPWYLERETNAGGEFKTGIRVPLARNRQIDARRAELWRATYERQRVVPEIRVQLINFVRDGSFAYWQWVAAGRKYAIGQEALGYAEQRNKAIRRKVEVGADDPPVLKDNRRAVAQREAKLVALRLKLEQAAIKLSLFYRTPEGQPLVLTGRPGKFPETDELFVIDEGNAVVSALSARPELAVLNAEAQKIRVDIAEASNNMLPLLDAQLVGSEDVGAPTSSKRDKSQFELEAGLYFDLPVQRRKAIGKLRASRAKLAQLMSKRQFTEDKIRAEVQAVLAALQAALERLEDVRESRELAEYMARVERRKFEVGETDLLLNVVLREQIAIEAAEAEVDVLLECFLAQADLDAVLARIWPSVQSALQIPEKRKAQEQAEADQDAEAEQVDAEQE